MMVSGYIGCLVKGCSMVFVKKLGKSDELLFLPLLPYPVGSVFNDVPQDPFCVLQELPETVFLPEGSPG